MAQPLLSVLLLTVVAACGCGGRSNAQPASPPGHRAVREICPDAPAVRTLIREATDSVDQGDLVTFRVSCTPSPSTPVPVAVARRRLASIGVSTRRSSPTTLEGRAPRALVAGVGWAVGSGELRLHATDEQAMERAAETPQLPPEWTFRPSGGRTLLFVSDDTSARTLESVMPATPGRWYVQPRIFDTLAGRFVTRPLRAHILAPPFAESDMVDRCATTIVPGYDAGPGHPALRLRIQLTDIGRQALLAFSSVRGRFLAVTLGPHLISVAHLTGPIPGGRIEQYVAGEEFGPVSGAWAAVHGEPLGAGVVCEAHFAELDPQEREGVFSGSAPPRWRERLPSGSAP